VPFRLLGVVARLDEVDSLCGPLFKSYAAGGTEVTLGWAPATERIDPRSMARRLGINTVTSLDVAPGPQQAGGLETAMLELISAIRPHVIVASSNQAVIWAPLVAAVSKARIVGTGSAVLPAKLYYRESAGTLRVAVTTVVRAARASSPEFFVRVLPDPWITGVLERDLFSGLVSEIDQARRLPAAS